MAASKSSKCENTPTADQCRNFLLAVVNAEDRAASTGTRARFEKLYRAWFPTDMTGEPSAVANAVRVLLNAYSAPQMWKCEKSVSEEKPTTEFHLSVAILRDKLRYIWAATNPRSAKNELLMARNDVLEYRRGGNDLAPEGTVDWRFRTLSALDWLDQNLHRIRICLNPECNETTYFVRETNNQRFCCATCWERAEELRRREKIRLSEPKRILSTEAKSAISHAQRKRWRKYRDQKKRRSK